MEIRPARLQDIPVLVALVSLNTSQYPVIPDKVKMKRLLVEAISTKSNFCWVSTQDNTVTGLLGAISQQGLWFERKHLHILYLSSTSRGGGQAMLRELMRWARPRKAIKVITTDFTVTPRMGNLLSRVGLTPHCTTHSFFK